MVRNSSQSFAKGSLGSVMKTDSLHSSGRLPEWYVLKLTILKNCVCRLTFEYLDDKRKRQHR